MVTKAAPLPPGVEEHEYTNLRRIIGDESRRWKTVHLKIMNGKDELQVPLMQASSVFDIRHMLADALGQEVAKIDLFEKKGISFKRLRNCEEVPSKVLVKGLKNFARCVQEYPHPICIIGAGHLGIRMGIHLERKGMSWQLFERKSKLGGNAWNGIANKWSKLQSEGAHYHLDWDSIDGREQILRPYERYSFWPTRDEIICHFHDIVSQFNLWPFFKMACQMVEMDIIPAPAGQDEFQKYYRMRHADVGDKFNKSGEHATAEGVARVGEQEELDAGFFTCSNITVYPGALAAPHRKTFPGEDVFGANIGYGFNDEFDYSLVVNQCGIVIGMGAFAVENVRTLMEHNAKKFFVVARHHNLLLPRILSWFINQSRMPPPAAAVLKWMEQPYKLYGKDPWSYFSITCTDDRKTASIKQYTRWGIGDIFFLAVYYGKVETIEGQIKRMKKRSAVLNNGRVLTQIDHLVKCLGFDSDFGIDMLMKIQAEIGFWPDGDWRRWICSDQSAIDASRFGGTAIAPYAASAAYWPCHFFEYPDDAKKLVASGIFPENRAKPELGSAAYHYDPRTAATVQVTYGSAVPGIAKWSGEHNDVFKKDSLWTIAPPEKFHSECVKDWFRYCGKFKDYGSEVDPPDYPYTIKDVYEMIIEEQEDTLRTGAVRAGWMTIGQMEENLQGMRVELMKRVENYDQTLEEFEERMHAFPPMPIFNEDGTLADEQGEVVNDTAGMESMKAIQALEKKTTADAERKQKEKEAASRTSTAKTLEPRCPESFAPARHIFQARAASPDERFTKLFQQEWLSGANLVKEAVLQAHGTYQLDN